MVLLSSSQVRKTNVNEQRLFLALSKDFSAVSTGGSKVIAASLNNFTFCWLRWPQCYQSRQYR